MAGGNTGGNAGGDATDNHGVVDECTITPILQDDGKPVRELVEIPKPKKASKVLNMLEKDDDEDEVTMALASIGKRIKKSLNDAQMDAILDELNKVVRHHMRAARGDGMMGYQLYNSHHKYKGLHNSSQPTIIKLCHHHHFKEWT